MKYSDDSDSNFLITTNKYLFLFGFSKSNIHWTSTEGFNYSVLFVVNSSSFREVFNFINLFFTSFPAEEYSDVGLIMIWMEHNQQTKFKKSFFKNLTSGYSQLLASTTKSFHYFSLRIKRQTCHDVFSCRWQTTS